MKPHKLALLLSLNLSVITASAFAAKLQMQTLHFLKRTKIT
ncbi:hypothetical protein CZ797_01495 [Pseudoalteromonas sp. JB197]|nr:hypothetical protein CZ797_01495 [Pseudoalteromonas sp. JB197]